MHERVGVHELERCSDRRDAAARSPPQASAAARQQHRADALAAGRAASSSIASAERRDARRVVGRERPRAELARSTSSRRSSGRPSARRRSPARVSRARAHRPVRCDPICSSSVPGVLGELLGCRDLLARRCRASAMRSASLAHRTERVAQALGDRRLRGARRHGRSSSVGDAALPCREARSRSSAPSLVDCPLIPPAPVDRAASCSSSSPSSSILRRAASSEHAVHQLRRLGRRVALGQLDGLVDGDRRRAPRPSSSSNIAMRSTARSTAPSRSSVQSLQARAGSPRRARPRAPSTPAHELRAVRAASRSRARPRSRRSRASTSPPTRSVRYSSIIALRRARWRPGSTRLGSRLAHAPDELRVARIGGACHCWCSSLAFAARQTRLR